MDPSVLSTCTVSDDELLQEALAVLDGFDFGDLEMLTPFIVEGTTDASDPADNLLVAVMDVARHPSILEVPMSTAAINGLEQETKPATPTTKHPRQGNSSHHTDVVEKLTPTGRGSAGQGRVRLREQLIQLRSVVQQMERHLETLKSPTSPRFNTCDGQNEVSLVAPDESYCNQTNSLDSAGDGENRTVWRTIAIQQFYDRRKAEQQNAQLRENLTTQIRLSKQLKTLLQSQQPNLGVSSGGDL